MPTNEDTIHNICPTCMRNHPRDAVGPIKFDKDSDTRCCFCNGVLELGYFTMTVHEGEVTLCTGHDDED